MKITFAGTPGTREREREEMANYNSTPAPLFLGYLTKPIQYSFCLRTFHGNKN